MDHAPVKLGDYANIALDRQHQWLLQMGDTLIKWRSNSAIHWRASTPKTFSAFQIETDSDNHIYLSDPYTRIKFAPSGKLQWSRARREVMLDGPNFMAVGPRGYVYTFGKTPSIVLNQYNPNGYLRWNRRFHWRSDHADSTGLVINSKNEPVILGYFKECGHQAAFIKQYHQQGRLHWQHQTFSIDLILWLIPVGFLIQIIQKLIKQKKEAIRDIIGDLLIMGLVIYAHFF